MPLRSKAFVVVAFLFKSYHAWFDVNYPSSSSDVDDLPVVPGCRLFKREDHLGLNAYCNSFRIPEILSSLPNNTIKLEIYGIHVDIKRPLLKNLFNLKELDMSQNYLNDFNSRILEGLSSLIYFGLKGNSIKKLSDDTFVHNPLLEKIDLSRNMVLSVAAVTSSLRNLVHLREINLANNMIISSLTFSDFAPLQNISLRSLLMDGCPIDRIDQDAFRPLKNLSVLDLSYTLLDATAVLNSTESLEFSSLRSLKFGHLRYLHSFPARFFKLLNMTSVAEIDVSFNRFWDFPLKGNFYPDLRFLDMTACGLVDENMPSGIFNAAPMLETLILKRNQFSAIQNQFTHLPNLKELDISDIKVSQEVGSFTIEDYAFRNLSSLEYLSLEGQAIRRGITRYTFHGLTGLEHIILTRCGIPAINDYAFETLGNLSILDLSFNLIENLNNYTFYGLKNVRTIKLNNNVLTYLNKSNPFQPTPILETLILDGNKINQLSPGIFDVLTNLGILRLADNVIVPWHKRVLSHNVSLLDISMNRIHSFSSEMLDDIRYLKALDFSYNPLNCAVCGMSDLQMWMSNTSTDINLLHNSESSPYACISPPELANISILDAKIPLAHCIEEELDLVLISLSVTIPIFACFLFASLVWYCLAWHIRYCCFKVKARVRVYKEVTRTDSYIYDAFVSHSPSDILWVRNCLLPALESGDHGCRLCIPDRDFEVAVSVTENLFYTVQNSRTTILVLSNAYLESEWCRFDMNMAQHKLFEDTRSLILILLEEIDSAKITKNLKYIIKTRTFIPWTNNPVGQRLFWDRLRMAVSRPDEKRLIKHIT